MHGCRTTKEVVIQEGELWQAERRLAHNACDWSGKVKRPRAFLPAWSGPSICKPNGVASCFPVAVQQDRVRHSTGIGKRHNDFPLQLASGHQFEMDRVKGGPFIRHDASSLDWQLVRASGGKDIRPDGTRSLNREGMRG